MSTMKIAPPNTPPQPVDAAWDRVSFDVVTSDILERVHEMLVELDALKSTLQPGPLQDEADRLVEGLRHVQAAGGDIEGALGLRAPGVRQSSAHDLPHIIHGSPEEGWSEQTAEDH